MAIFLEKNATLLGVFLKEYISHSLGRSIRMLYDVEGWEEVIPPMTNMAEHKDVI